YLNDKTLAALDTAFTNPAEYTRLITLYTEKIASDMSRGRMLPSELSSRVRIAAKTFSAQAAVQNYLNGRLEIRDLVSQLEPKNAMYLKQAQVVSYLRALRDSPAAEVPKDLPMVGIKLGSTNARLVSYLRSRLNIFGYRVRTDSTLFDEELKQTVSAFQYDQKLDVDGSVGPNTWGALNRSIGDILMRASVNLDRTRWLPNTLEPQRIAVNLAEQTFVYYENNSESLSFKTINGRVDRQTPIMIDSAKTVVLNPTWTVPFSIFVKDKLPILKQDPSYVTRLHMDLIDDLTGQKVDPMTVDWSLIDSTNLHYTLIQRPGPWNALGFIKFPLGNPYAIYLHDTDSRALFEKNPRLFSSGCVRLEKPFDLGEKLLGNPKWTVDSLKAATELNPVMATASTFLKAKNPVPVYLLYTTLFQSNDGRIVVLPDSYGIDQEMMARLSN
ncbi:MAG: L,D-transpeptidase family protein, partial [Bdellovibrionaceae bacterium]|nr:L,D-transpeptidase family protein [Pseudobdellovibrionaceae bacterium]